MSALKPQLLGIPRRAARLHVLSRVEIPARGRLDLASIGPAILAVQSGQLRVRLGRSQTLLGPGGLARASRGAFLRLEAERWVEARFLELESGQGGEPGAGHPFGPGLDVLQALVQRDAGRLSETLERHMRGLHLEPSPHTPLGRVRRLVLSSLNRPLGLAEMAEAARENPFTLIRKFRRWLGTTPCAYHLAVRLSAARLRLFAGSPASQVAHDLGFSDQSHFTRRFQQSFGVTPGRYMECESVALESTPAPHKAAAV